MEIFTDDKVICDKEWVFGLRPERDVKIAF